MELKENRWVKIHEPGQANFETKDNVMDICIGEKACKAEAIYTVSSIKKAAYWTLTYLESAEAKDILAVITDSVTKAAALNEDINLQESTWSLSVDKLTKGTFNVRLEWIPSEPVTKKPKANKKSKAAKNAAGEVTTVKTKKEEATTKAKKKKSVKTQAGKEENSDEVKAES